MNQEVASNGIPFGKAMNEYADAWLTAYLKPGCDCVYKNGAIVPK